MSESLHRARLATPVGTLTLVATDAGLRAVLWPGEADPFASEASDDEHPLLRSTIEQLQEYFAGERRSFDVPLDLVGTAFQLEAWRALAKVPYGKTVSYAEQARRLGRPLAARAVGAANGRNPVSIVLPCHRVIGTNGSLTGYGGGLDVKRQLLALEAAVVSGATRAARSRRPR